MLSKSNSAVVYRFTSPSGRHYIGKHVAPGCDLWPDEGTGPLPDGYKGSGTYWKKAIAKYGIEAMSWVLLDRCPCEASAYEMELFFSIEARAKGGSLYNGTEGGAGDSDGVVGLQLTVDPSYAAKRERLMSNPDTRHRIPPSQQQAYLLGKESGLSKSIKAAAWKRP
jgi:hypothetical protein